MWVESCGFGAGIVFCLLVSGILVTIERGRQGGGVVARG
jgi:hypothetical protein